MTDGGRPGPPPGFGGGPPVAGGAGPPAGPLGGPSGGPPGGPAAGSGPSASPTPRFAPTPSRRRRPWGWLVALLVVVGIGVAAFVVLGGDDEPEAGGRDGTGDRREDAGPTGDTAEEAWLDPANAGGGWGGSRFMAFTANRDGGPSEIVRVLLGASAEMTLQASMDEVYTEVALGPVNALAWEVRPRLTEEQRDARVRLPTEVRIVNAEDAEPVSVAADDVRCPSWFPDGRLLVVVVSPELVPTLAVVDPSTGAVVEALPVDLAGAQRMAEAPGSCPAPAGDDHVVFPRDRGPEEFDPAGAEIVRVALDGSGAEVVGHTAPYCIVNGLAATLDGERLAVAVVCDRLDVPAAEGNGVMAGSMADDLAPVVAENAPGSGRTDGAIYYGPTWTPDGSVLAYQRQAAINGTPSTWVVAEGGEPWAFPKPIDGFSPGPGSSPSFSPD